MHFKDGFHDRNGQRYMISTRVRKLLDMLRGEYYYTESFDPGPFKMVEGDLSYEEAMAAQGRSFDGSQDRWGSPDSRVWFFQRVVVPERLEGKILHYDCDVTWNSGWYWGAPQSLLYVNGEVATGMDVNHRFFELTSCAKAGQVFDIAIDTFTDRFSYKGQIEMKMAVRVLNPLAQKLFYDIMVPLDITEYMDDNNVRRVDILRYLNNALSLVDFRLPSGEAFDATLQDALDYMDKEFYGAYCGNPESTVTCVGHTHIDTAWMWTLQHTHRKVVRSFSSVLNLLDRYEEMRFMSSQPQLYQFLKEDYPEVYARLQEKVKSGQWEAEGGMWVEADTNIPNGESLVRQIMYGKRFFRDEFGVDNKVLWLPDVFGYSACLPQILKKSGMDYFMTTKISWNEYDKFPYDTFRWRGLDGSEVLSHFICDQHVGMPETDYLTTYNGVLCAADVMGSWRRYQQKDLNKDILMAYGYGDGGGGPTADMVEQAKRLAKGIPGCPQVKFGTSLEYFKKLDAEVSNNKYLPVWNGEIYFEYHRGTYTSVAKIKKNVRKSEILLQDTEFFSVLRDQLCGTSTYPKAQLNGLWHTLLLNEFHDIVPGSSIKEVYDDSDRQFKQLCQQGSVCLQAALTDISGQIGLENTSLVVFNSTSFVRSEVAEFTTDLENFEILDGEKSLPWQRTMEGTVLFFATDVPAKGYRTFTLCPCEITPKFSTVTVDARQAETPFFKVVLDDNGNIVSLYDKSIGRELARPEAPMNSLVALEDVPPVDDAWNINAYINEKTWTIQEVDSIEVVERGPVRSVVRIQRPFMNSHICQDMVFYADLPRIDVYNCIDWKDKNILLKADFPFAVNAVRATYDVQFGNLERSTTNNTSWDFAQFEVSAHQWADLSEEGYGLSILNDCKYGYDIKDGHLRLTLLKSAVHPYYEADKEVHTFVYSIYPHDGSWKSENTVEMAASINCPLHTVVEQPHVGPLPKQTSLVSSNCKNVRVETVKLAEDSDDVILRLNEFHNRTTPLVLTFDRPIKAACVCNLLEEPEEALVCDGNILALEIKPFEICTLKVAF